MADDLIHCPACNHQLRLPPGLYGQTVECPQCHTRFVAPAPQPPAVRPVADRPPPGREYDAGRPAYDEPPPYTRGPNPLTAPGVCLLVAAIAGAAVSGYMTVGWIALKSDPKAFEQMMTQALDKNPQLGPNDRAQFREVMTQFRDFAPAACGALLGLNLVTAIGAGLMLARRGYWLAVLGNVLALNPVNLPCCLLQVPFGIWGLIALMTESGRRAFR